MNTLAITSVPVQSWEQPWDDAKALKEGTIFPSLYKPFYVVENMQPTQAMPQSEWESKLCAIGQVSFAITDILLYLDTHPEDQEAHSALESHRSKRKTLMEQFAANYYPLTQDCEGCWADGPVPWDNPADQSVNVTVASSVSSSNCTTLKGGL